MAAEDDELFGITRGGSPEVSGLIGLHLAVYVVQFAFEPVAGFGPLVRPGDAAGAVRTAREVGYFVQLLYRAPVVYVLDGFHLSHLLSASDLGERLLEDVRRFLGSLAGDG